MTMLVHFEYFSSVRVFRLRRRVTILSGSRQTSVFTETDESAQSNRDWGEEVSARKRGASLTLPTHKQMFMMFLVHFNCANLGVLTDSVVLNNSNHLSKSTGQKTG